MIVVSYFLQDEATLLGPNLSWTRSRLKEFLNTSLFRHMQPPPPSSVQCGDATYPFMDGEEPPPRGDALRDTPLTYACTGTHLSRGGEPTSSIKSAPGLWSKQGTTPTSWSRKPAPSTADLSVHGHRPSADSNVRHLRGSDRTLRQPSRTPSVTPGTTSTRMRSPPFHLGGRVVARVRETPDLSMTLAAPLGPEKAWFADLLLLLTQPPLTLPLWDRLQRQPHFHRFHGGVRARNLHAWRLSSVSSESWVFRERLHARCPKCVRESTACLYQSQWLFFYNWCR